MIPTVHRRIIGWGALIIVAVMPFHAFLTVWAGHLLGHQSWWQAWKEILVVIMLLVALDAFLRQPKLLLILNTPANRWAGGFILAGVAVTLLTRPWAVPVWYGLKTDFEFLVVFGLAQLAAGPAIRKQGEKILLITAAAVAGIAVFQATLINPAWLEWFGYGPATILARQSANGFTRAFSTLGGPNQLGAFLILPICLALTQFVRRPGWLKAVMLGLLALGLFFSLSRSAWLGALIAVGLIIWHQGTRRRPALLALAAIILIMLFSPLRGALVRNQVSDPQHWQAVNSGLGQIIRNPWGYGLGTAGPASFKGPNVNLPENFYLQIAIETGIIGLILFVGLHWQLARRLFALGQPTALAMTAGLLGVSVVNFFLHGWADSSTALTYWTLAGLTVGANHVATN